ncbi:TetR/AcrR family transcriptional regulator [Kitasatospora sp. NPDC050463]|uniref:TetR/AcrR family transcriptional regulator n=1 Tax=Kitasatospora sp. NPDC050463 TaxID=3155786 RepID=UPI00340E1018
MTPTDRPRPTPTARRADAERSINAILDAAAVGFGRSPDTTMAEIARAAGVGRVTLYGHFNSREAVLDALLERTLAEIDSALDAADPETGPAADALVRFLATPWLLDRFRGLYAAAVRHLGPDHVRSRHEPVFHRLEQLISRGQHEGSFRTDLPRPWLITTIYALVHALISEVEEGNLPSGQAVDVLTRTLLGLLAPYPGQERSDAG